MRVFTYYCNMYFGFGYLLSLAVPAAILDEYDNIAELSSLGECFDIATYA